MEIRDISSSHTIQIMPSYEMLEVIVGSNLPLDLKMFCVSTHQSMFSFDAKDLPLTSIVRPPKARNELLAEHWIALLHWIRSSLGHGVEDETSRSTVVFSDLSSVLNNQLNAALRQDLPVVLETPLLA